jgi:hypothetical protein
VKRTGLTVAIAWVGVVLGHLAACFLAYPDASGRHVHLQTSGHTWLELAGPSLLAIVPVVLLALAVGVVRANPAPAGSGLAVRLMAIQIPAFVLTELFVSGAAPGWSPAEPAVFLGLVLQPLAAVVAAWLVDLFQRAVHTLVTRLQRSVAPVPRSLPGPPRRTLPSRFRLLVHAQRRAPPLPSSV